MNRGRKTVWFVQSFDDDHCTQILGAFSSRESAARAIAMRSCQDVGFFDPQEVEIDSVSGLIDEAHEIGRVHRAIVRVGDGFLVPEQETDVGMFARHPTECVVSEPRSLPHRGSYNWIVALSPISREHAIEAAMAAREAALAKRPRK